MSQIVNTRIEMKNDNRRGFILLLHAVMLFFTIAMIGLAVDAGTMYVIKGRLQSAIDAAALAAGRSVNLADTVSAASTAATTTATQFFNANFPSGYLGTGTMNLTTPTFTQETDANGNPNGILDIVVTASLPAPTYFMQIFGVPSVTVSGTGTATRRGTVMILVLDTSSSMNTPTTPTACAEMVSATQTFITNFSPYDTIGVVTFDYTAKVLYKPVTTFGDGTLNTALGTITCGNNTNTTSALYLAYEEIKKVGLPLAYNSIVLFTDGSPNGITASFPIYLTKDTRYGEDSTDKTCTSTGTLCSMPVICTGTTNIIGTITQTSGQTDTGNTSGLYTPISTDTAPSYPAGCNSGTFSPNSNFPRQVVAYIPDTDLYGNNTHGVPATSSTGTAANVTIPSTGKSEFLVSRDLWEYQVNNLCTGATGTAKTACDSENPTKDQQWGGGLWSSYPTAGSTGTNFFTAGAYKGFFRPDQPTTIVAVSMNTAMDEAYYIRKDQSGCTGYGTNGTQCTTLYHPVINTIYLTGNAGDAVDHEFLPIMANTQSIIALPYDSSFTAYTNPAFQQDQETGLYQVTADKTQLTTLFQKLASEVLRLSH